jgi:hypothetical protein
MIRGRKRANDRKFFLEGALSLFLMRITLNKDKVPRVVTRSHISVTGGIGK